MENQTKRFTLNRSLLVGLILGIVLSVAGMGIVVASGGADMGEVGEIESIEPGALSITDMQARETVLEAYPDTTIKEVDLDTQADGNLVYDVSLDNGKEYMVDARTGKLLGEEADDGDDSHNDD